jgi:hypothetical protein
MNIADRWTIELISLAFVSVWSASLCLGSVAGYRWIRGTDRGEPHRSAALSFGVQMAASATIMLLAAEHVMLDMSMGFAPVMMLALSMAAALAVMGVESKARAGIGLAFLSSGALMMVCVVLAFFLPMQD